MAETLHTTAGELEELWAAVQGRGSNTKVDREALEHLLMDHGKLVGLAKRVTQLLEPQEKENVAVS